MGPVLCAPYQSRIPPSAGPNNRIKLHHKVVYQNNPILRWCLINTAKKSTNKDGIESIQPVKCASNRRIDGMVSLLNAWTGYHKHIDEFLPYVR